MKTYKAAFIYADYFVPLSEVSVLLSGVNMLLIGGVVLQASINVTFQFIEKLLANLKMTRTWKHLDQNGLFRKYQVLKCDSVLSHDARKIKIVVSSFPGKLFKTFDTELRIFVM